MATIEIDGQVIQAEAGTMLIEATDRAGIYIPRFCYHEKLSIAANCRMCLVEVEKVGKPMPACATPITDGMKVFTRSELARVAQQATLEFLLINHPLDCPVCDQGGECPLQDQAMGYGDDASRFVERKRAVVSHDIGPLIATEMTRCIHCTRCVRFGEEVAGAMEMGLPGRGEWAHIATFLNRSVDSEVSGNMIDLCPVGALTSKPYRFAARSWELDNHRGISPHDCVGTNLNIQTLRGQVERVLPRENAQVNECWLADRDRYSYEGVNSARRLLEPMVKDNGKWKAVSWEEALRRASSGIRSAVAASGDDLGAVAGYTATLEEYYLLQKLARALGSNHIDHRLQQRDFRDDDAASGFPGSELPIDRFDTVQAALLVGANIRKEQPLLALRLRTAVRQNGARISALNPLEYPQNFATQATVCTGADLVRHLAYVAAEIANITGNALPADIQQWVGKRAMRHAEQQSDPRAESAIASSLLAAGRGGDSSPSVGAGSAAEQANADPIKNETGEASGETLVIIGALAQQHEDASVIKGIARWICQCSGARLAILPPGNSAAAWRAGCLPHRDGRGVAVASGYNATELFDHPRRAYVLLGTDPELDSVNGQAALNALGKSGFVVQITPYQSESDYAHVLLPMAAFTESAGTFVNCEGRAQQAEVAAAPRGESRPAWKILRVLGNFLELPGFDYVSLDQVTAEVNLDAPTATDTAAMKWKIPGPRDGDRGGDADAKGTIAPSNSVQRLLDIPMYRGDQTVRNASALQKTADNPAPAAWMNQTTIDRLGLRAAAFVRVCTGLGSAHLALRADDRVPPDCVYVPAGYTQTIALGESGRVTVVEEEK